MEVFEAKGRYMTELIPPVLACRRCGAVVMPSKGQTSIFCRCGKVYTLMAEGAPVRKIMEPAGR